MTHSIACMQPQSPYVVDNSVRKIRKNYARTNTILRLSNSIYVFPAKAERFEMRDRKKAHAPNVNKIWRHCIIRKIVLTFVTNILTFQTLFRYFSISFRNQNTRYALSCSQIKTYNKMFMPLKKPNLSS
jgi:hypothetical protein